MNRGFLDVYLLMVSKNVKLFCIDILTGIYLIMHSLLNMICHQSFNLHVLTYRATISVFPKLAKTLLDIQSGQLNILPDQTSIYRTENKSAQFSVYLIKNEKR